MGMDGCSVVFLSVVLAILGGGEASDVSSGGSQRAGSLANLTTVTPVEDAVFENSAIVEKSFEDTPTFDATLPLKEEQLKTTQKTTENPPRRATQPNPPSLPSFDDVDNHVDASSPVHVDTAGDVARQMVLVDTPVAERAAVDRHGYKDSESVNVAGQGGHIDSDVARQGGYVGRASGDVASEGGDVASEGGDVASEGGDVAAASRGPVEGVQGRRHHQRDTLEEQIEKVKEGIKTVLPITPAPKVPSPPKDLEESPESPESPESLNPPSLPVLPGNPERIGVKKGLRGQKRVTDSEGVTVSVLALLCVISCVGGVIVTVFCRTKCCLTLFRNERDMGITVDNGDLWETETQNQYGAKASLLPKGWGKDRMDFAIKVHKNSNIPGNRQSRDRSARNGRNGRNGKTSRSGGMRKKSNRRVRFS